MLKPSQVYDLMLDVVASNDAIVEELIIGLTWTYCRSSSTGLCMTADTRSRTFEWSGSLLGQSVSFLAGWIHEWDPMKSSIAMAAINSVINHNEVTANKQVIPVAGGNENLSVFEYFLPHIKSRNTVVVGRYPGLEHFQQQYDLKVIEINPGKNDLPVQACEFVLPEAELIFLTGTSIANKTFPRLMELSQNATVVLMGPSVPWLDDLSEFGVDFIAGVSVLNDIQLKQVVAEGGGVNIFKDAVQYCIYDLGKKKLEETQIKISNTVNRRELLKEEMENWYKNAKNGTFPKAFELVTLDEELSCLDTQFKKMWDIRQSLPQ